MGVGVDGSKILNHKMCSLCVALQNTCFGMLFRAECDHWHNTQNMVSRIDTIVKASLVPRPLAHVKRVWCSEQHFLSHGVGPISNLRSPIRLQKT